jgi:hypothetical protein
MEYKGTVLMESSRPARFEIRKEGGEWIRVDKDRAEVFPGRYEVCAFNSGGGRVACCVDVFPIMEVCLIVDTYKVSDASTFFTNDGRVEAEVKGGRQGDRYVWNTGTITDSPKIEDVGAGTYFLVSSSVPTLHLCSPALVNSKI